jgi:hypothetical protein
MHINVTKEMVFAWARSEEDAASYYRNCYEADPSVRECNIYANNGPLSNRTDDDDCPFQGDVCLLGPHSAITLDTGYTDVNTLGINSRNRPFFRRKTTCSPLVTDGYVNIQDNYSGILIEAQFYYGPGKVFNWTHTQARIFRVPGVSSPAYEIVIKNAWCLKSLSQSKPLADLLVGKILCLFQSSQIMTVDILCFCS